MAPCRDRAACRLTVQAGGCTLHDLMKEFGGFEGNAQSLVFLSGEFDFYRTRLTHSLGVAQIGSICSFLKQTSPFLNETFFVDPDLVEAVCLTHDLGHSSFGHAGERGYA
jgi:dGTP triphosphohydrolase